MNDRYLFDKRILKKRFKKYGLMFLLILPFIIAFNVLMNGLIDNGIIILLDIIIILMLILVCEIALKKIANRKLQKQQKDVVVVKKGTLNKKSTKVTNNKNKANYKK